MAQYIQFWLAKTIAENIASLGFIVIVLVLGTAFSWVSYLNTKRRDQFRVLEDVKQLLNAKRQPPLTRREEAQVKQYIWHGVPLTKDCYSVSLSVHANSAVEFVESIRVQQKAIAT